MPLLVGDTTNSSGGFNIVDALQTRDRMAEHLRNAVGQPDTPAMRAALAAQLNNEVRNLQAQGAILRAMNLNMVAGNTTTTYTSNDLVWPQWNITYTTASASGTNTSITASNNGNIWTIWNNTYTSTGTTITATAGTNAINTYAWEVFNDRYERIREAGADADRVRRYSRRQLSEEELLAELERERRLREEAEKRQLEAAKAVERAEQLLRACLTARQLEDLKTKNCFYVEIEGQNGKKERYRIDRGSHGNVKQLDERGSIIRSFCIQPPDVPAADAMLAQKLYLEGSEEAREKFWETANITELVREKTVPAHIPRRERRKYAMENGLLH